MIIKLNITKKNGEKYEEIFSQDEKGRWIIHTMTELFGKTEYVCEEDVIEMVKKHDRQNLNKYFPMVGFHN